MGIDSIILYHATDNAEAILEHGIDMDADRRRDPGDFGWGFYLTSSLVRARELGSAILAVEIDVSSYTHLPFPYFLDRGSAVAPRTTMERLFHSLVFDGEGRMCTVRGPIEERISVAKLVRNAFLAMGYGGITTPHDEGETVVFDPATVVSVKLLERS